MSNKCPFCGAPPLDHRRTLPTGIEECSACEGVYTVEPIDPYTSLLAIRWNRLRVVDTDERDERRFRFEHSHWDGTVSVVDGTYHRVTGEAVRYE